MNEKIIEILVNVLKLEGDSQMIGEDDDLIEIGLNSLNAIEIVVNLENEFDIQVDDDDLLIDNLASVKLLRELIERYKG